MRKNKSKYVAKAKQQKSGRPYWLVKLMDKLENIDKNSPSNFSSKPK